MDVVRSSILGALMLSLSATVHAGGTTSPDDAARSEIFTDLAPALLPETVRLDSLVSPGEYVFLFVLDTAGRVEPGTVQTLMAVDSASAALARRALGDVRYTPARLVGVSGVCVRINGAEPLWKGWRAGAETSKARAVAARGGVSCVPLTRQRSVKRPPANLPGQLCAAQGCTLGAVHRFAYPELPDDAQMLWYKQLG